MEGRYHGNLVLQGGGNSAKAEMGVNYVRTELLDLRNQPSPLLEIRCHAITLDYKELYHAAFGLQGHSLLINEREDMVFVIFFVAADYQDFHTIEVF